MHGLRLTIVGCAVGCLAAGAALTQAPPVFDAPIGGYLAVALLLVGGIALMPRVTAIVFRRAMKPRNAVATLALARLANAPGQASIAMGGVLWIIGQALS